MKKIILIVNIIFLSSRFATAQNYTEMANEALSDHLPIVDFNNGGRIINKAGQFVWVGCATDDPWMHPFINIFRGADGGFDIICTVDPSQDIPGEGEIDAHVGSPDPQHPFQEHDTRGDLFILGDHKKPYYTGKRFSSDAEDDFVYIYRFEVNYSQIQLHGTSSDYILAEATNQETGVEGTAIFYTAAGTDDMIAFVENVTPTQISLNSNHYVFPETPNQTPSLASENRIAQWGNGGINTFGRIAVNELGEIFQTFISSGPDFAGIGDDKGSFYLVKYAPTGEVIWLRKHGVPVDAENKGEMPFNIQVSDEYIFIAGHTKGAYGGPTPFPEGNEGTLGIIAVFDAADGDFIGVSRTVPNGENGNVWSLAVDSDQEHVYVTGGTSANDVNFPHTSPYLKKLKIKDFSKVWTDIIIDEEGDHPLGPYYFQISNESIAKASFFQDPDNNRKYIYISGYATAGDFLENSKPGVCNAWVAKYTDSGERLWAKAFQSPTGNQYPWGTAVDQEGNVYIVGQTYGPMGGADPKGVGDGFITKFAGDGQFLWTRLLGTEKSDDLHSVQIVNNKYLVVGGTTWGDLAVTNAGQSDGYVSILDLDGNIISSFQFGSEGIDYLRDALVYGEEVFISGITNASLSAPSSGGWDVFLARFEITFPQEILSAEEGELKSALNIYPNPSADILHIDSSMKGLMEVFLYNSHGQLVKKSTTTNSQSYLDIHDLISGVYFLTAIQNGHIYSHKVIKN